MAPSTNWLSFSLSPHFLPYHSSFNNFNSINEGWSNSEVVEENQETTFHNPQRVAHEPKVEDFLGESSSASTMMTYLERQEGSCLTEYINENGSGGAYFGGFSGSEVEDSGSIGTNQMGGLCNLGPSGGGVSVAVVDTNVVPLLHSDSSSSNKVADTFGQRTSIYRGVTRHRWTGRYEAHLWDNSCRREGQARKGRQVYLGGYDKEDKAARSYDLAALKYWGSTATTNFPVSNYTKELEEMKHVTKLEFIASLRRKSSGFSRGASIYRGVTRHHQQGRWQARIGRVAGNKDLYLGTFATEEEAAEAYDIAAIKFRGLNAVTNFEMNRYDVEAIAKSALPIGGAAKRLKICLESEQKMISNHDDQTAQFSSGSNTINFGAIFQAVPAVPREIPYEIATMLYHHNYFHHLQPNVIGSSDSTSPTVAASTEAPQAADFFVWPHQSY